MINTTVSILYRNDSCSFMYDKAVNLFREAVLSGEKNQDMKELHEKIS